MTNIIRTIAAAVANIAFFLNDDFMTAWTLSLRNNNFEMLARLTNNGLRSEGVERAVRATDLESFILDRTFVGRPQLDELKAFLVEAVKYSLNAQVNEEIARLQATIIA